VINYFSNPGKVILLLVFLFLCLVGCGSQVSNNEEFLVQVNESGPSQETEPQENVATLVVVGDIMVHDTQIAQAYDSKTGNYNFDESLSEVASYLKEGDLTLGNLETTLAGEDLQYSGYPQFNTPESLAKTLKNVGFDLLFTANNHTYDRRELGVVRTIENLKAYGLESVGTRQAAEEEGLLLKEVNGIKMAFLAYTYGLNGFSLPEGKEYLVNLLELERILSDIQKVRRQADLVICYLHFGQEYSNMPTDEQRKIVELLCAEGVDIVLGSHPHVLQEIWLNENRTKMAIYSMGNFVSSQKGLERTTSAIFRITILKDNLTGKVEIKAVEYIPIYTQRYVEHNKLKFKVIPISYALRYRPYEFLEEKDYDTLEKALKHVQETIAPPSSEVIKEYEVDMI